MTQVLLFDSNVWSHLVLGDARKRDKVQADISVVMQKYPLAERAVSGICVAECLVAARRMEDPVARASAEALFRELLTHPGVTLVPVTEAVLDRAASLRAECLRRASAVGSQAAGSDGGKLKLPDAIIAASCLVFDPPAILVTENAADFCYLDDTGTLCTVGGLSVERVG